jgi:isopentenyl diphosphate isomerase/L-lactate dehydrogenase-like FMN-dependent dehydrogenase
MYALAIGGGDGVTRLLTTLRDDVRAEAGLAGINSIHDLPSDLAVRSGG